MPSGLDTPRLHSARNASHSSLSIRPALRWGVSSSLRSAGPPTARARAASRSRTCMVTRNSHQRRPRWRHGCAGSPVMAASVRRAGTLLAQAVSAGFEPASAALYAGPSLTCADCNAFSPLTLDSGPLTGLLMRLGFAPFRGSNPRASAPDQGVCAKVQAPWLTSVIIFAFCLRSTRIGGPAERVRHGDTPSRWTARMRSASDGWSGGKWPGRASTGAVARILAAPFGSATTEVGQRMTAWPPAHARWR